MATVTCVISASPAQMFTVLADGWSYSNWVVGTSHVRAVSASWPQVGAKVFHATGAWPMVVRDETVVEAVQDGRSITLTAKGRPFGTARVIIDVTPDGESTHVSMHETPVAGPGKWLHNSATEALLVRRNTESLARLTAVTERRTHPTGTG